MKRILVPLDGSGFAERAIPVAVDLAQLTGASLSLVSANESPFDRRVFGPDPRADADRAAALDYLSEWARRLGTDRSGSVEFDLLDGHPAPALAGFIARTCPDLVIMTTHGRGPWSRLWLGSVADHLLKTTTRPILLIRPHERPDQSLVLRRVLVPLDLSSESDSVLGTIGPLARLADAELTLFHVLPPAGIAASTFAFESASIPAEYTERLRVEAEAKLASLADKLRADGLRASSLVRIEATAASAIVSEAARGGYQLIALATRSPRGLTRAVIGSVADKVVRAAEAPVLVTHAASGSRPTQ